MKVEIRWATSIFGATLIRDRTQILVSRRAVKEHANIFELDEEERARQWLGDMGLDCRQARRLLDAAIRGAGPFRQKTHPRRVNV